MGLASCTLTITLNGQLNGSQSDFGYMLGHLSGIIIMVHIYPVDYGLLQFIADIKMAILPLN